MSKQIFVGGLSWGITDVELREAFESLGELEDVKVITDRQTGRSRGFGFVTFIEDEVAATAISEMDGKELDGRAIRVSEARKKQERDDNRGGPRGGNRGRRDY